MKAVEVGADGAMSWGEAPTPEPAPGEVRIKVHASAINRADLMQRRGFYPPPPGASPILGLECAGTIDALGEGTTGFEIGDRVCALLSGGGYAEYACADAGSVVPVPGGLSFAHGAALPEVFATAWLNLFIEAGLRPGEKVLLHAGASGVGTAGIQLCTAFGNPVFVTAGAENKLDACIELGAAGGANRHDGPFLESVRSFAGESGLDVILDPVGAGYLADNLALLGLNGRLVLIGLMSGTKAEIDLAAMMGKRLRIIGSTLRARPVEEKARIMAELEREVWPLIEAGKIRPIVDTVYPVTDVGDAFDYVQSDVTIGKVVLAIAE